MKQTKTNFLLFSAMAEINENELFVVLCSVKINMKLVFLYFLHLNWIRLGYGIFLLAMST
jgi:hypothetical protein